MQHYRLKHPITGKDGAVIISEVVLRRPKGKDLRASERESSSFDGTLVLIERLCSQPNGEAVFAGFADELDVEDIDALGEFVEAMLPSGPKTGGTP